MSAREIAKFTKRVSLLTPEERVALYWDLQDAAIDLHEWTWLYFIQEGDDGPIKIGVADDPRARLKKMQTSNSRELRLLAVKWEPVGMEKDLHAHLSHLRVRGEWFEPAPQLLKLVRQSDDPSILDEEDAA